VNKKSLCTWWLEHRKLQVMFSVPRQSPDIYCPPELSSRRPCSVQQVHIPNVITVSDWNSSIIFFACCCTVTIRCTHTFYHPVYSTIAFCLFDQENLNVSQVVQSV
jgi:hypothetical protein